jgi:5,10-methylenetetrahydromethanopterin reductase
LKFGIGLKPDENPLDIARLVELAERNGLSHAWIVDSQLLSYDVYVTLALSAAVTSNIKLCTGVTNPYTRHPTVTANSIMSINEVSNGRAVLGLGAGFSSAVPLGIRPSLHECRKLIETVRLLLEGRRVDFNGKKVRLEHRKKGGVIPIYLAASRSKMLELAGEVCDGVIISAGSVPNLVSRAIDSVRIGAEKAKRDLKDLDLICNIGCSISEDGKIAKEEAKTFAARRAVDMMSRLPFYMAQIKADAKIVSKQYDMSKHMSVDAKHADFVTKEMIECFTLSGTPEEIKEKAFKLNALGINQIIAFLVTKRKRCVIETLGKIEKGL